MQRDKKGNYMKFFDYLHTVYIFYLKLVSFPALNILFMILLVKNFTILNWVIIGLSSLCWIIAVVLTEIKK